MHNSLQQDDALRLAWQNRHAEATMMQEFASHALQDATSAAAAGFTSNKSPAATLVLPPSAASSAAAHGCQEEEEEDDPNEEALHATICSTFLAPPSQPSGHHLHLPPLPLDGASIIIIVGSSQTRITFDREYFLPQPSSNTGKWERWTYCISS